MTWLVYLEINVPCFNEQPHRQRTDEKLRRSARQHDVRVAHRDRARLGSRRKKSSRAKPRIHLLAAALNWYDSASDSIVLKIYDGTRQAFSRARARIRFAPMIKCSK